MVAHLRRGNDLDVTTVLPVDAREVRRQVDERLARFFDDEADRWAPVHPELAEMVETVRRFVEGGGKRLRASFCCLGWWAALAPGGDLDLTPAVDVAAAVEMLHAFALIHDDVMDGSDLRRGRPSVHRQLESVHAAAGWRGEGRRFGEGMAVLLGDAALSWADCLLAPHRALVGEVWDELRVELTMGQYLDVVGAAQGATDGAAAGLVAALKSGRYSVMRPLQLGAALAGRLGELAEPFAEFGEPVGEAFQLRDDLLGVFGDPALTGKPAGEDLREGKPTLLLACADEAAAGDPLLRRVGQPDLAPAEIDALRSLLVACGAAAAVEAAIQARVLAGRRALELAPISPAGRAALGELAGQAAWRCV